MKFRTEVPAPQSLDKISYDSSVLFLGSCFSLSIHNQLQNLKFHTFSNPFGIVYNPTSLSKQLKRVCTEKKYLESDLHFHNERWFSFDHHSDFSYPSKEDCLHSINHSLEQAHAHLKKSDFIFITLGTAWTYHHDKLKRSVSNCHKISSKNFTKKLTQVDEMVHQLIEAIQDLKSINPSVKVVFSVSPIRHLSDGHFENQVSKGRLFDTIHQLLAIDNSTRYFPAYELLLDDLRDYRFYNSDLLHPSSEAIEYIWSKFSETFINSNTSKTITRIEKLIQASKHQPFNPYSTAHQKFIQKTLNEMNLLESELGFRFIPEKTSLQNQQI
ncbi:MAG: hypothetical protein ACI9GM_001153 [Salibacteraceae bacterium]|jgi:hypothetical protein